MVCAAFMRHLRFVGDDWKALDLFEEAADLGVWGAQENVAYMFDSLVNSHCTNKGTPPQSSYSSSPSAPDHLHMCLGESDKFLCCKEKLEKWASNRWALLSAVGEPRAMRKTGETLLSLSFEADGENNTSRLREAHQKAAVLFALAAEQGDTESLMNLGWMYYDSSAGLYIFNISTTNMFKLRLFVFFFSSFFFFFFSLFHSFFLSIFIYCPTFFFVRSGF